MPIYAYKCDACGFAKDVLQKISDAVLQDCPACGKASFTKQLTSAGFQLKGSGWYATDFKGSGSAAAAAATAPATPSAEPATVSTPATPAAKPEVTSAAPAAGCGGGCACHS